MNDVFKDEDIDKSTKDLVNVLLSDDVTDADKELMFAVDQSDCPCPSCSGHANNSEDDDVTTRLSMKNPVVVFGLLYALLLFLILGLVYLI